MDPNSHFSSSTSKSNHTNKRNEKEDVAKSEPAVTLHYAALPDKVSIKKEHVAKIMGMVPYDYEEVKKTWEQYKKEVRAYAVDEIKKRILKEAQTISDEGFLPVLIRNGEESRPPRKFNDIMLWWRQLFDEGDYMITEFEDIQAASQTLNHLQNGMWKKYWAKDMEIQFMETMNWCYDEESYNQLQRQCKRTGFEVIGCVAKNIAAVKGEIVKYWQRSCRNDTDSRVYVYKSRPTTSAYGKDGKYVKLEKGEFTFTVPRKTMKPAGEMQLPVLNQGKVGRTFVHFSLLLCSFFPFQLIYIYIYLLLLSILCRNAFNHHWITTIQRRRKPMRKGRIPLSSHLLRLSRKLTSPLRKMLSSKLILTPMPQHLQSQREIEKIWQRIKISGRI